MQRLIVYIAIMLLSACAQGSLDQNEVENKIIGGKNELGFKSVVLSLSASGELCTGSLIAPNLVLTAAHCIFNRSTMQDDFAQSVTIGSNLRGGKQIPVAKSIAHPEYKKPKGEADYENYDIALLILRSDAVGIDPLPISALRAQEFIGKDLLAVGFGLNDEARQGGAGVKRSVTLEIKKEIEGRFVAEKMGAEIQDTCSGDSGGPGFVNINGVWTILGTVKRGEIEGCVGLTYYVQVAAHLTWINNIVQEHQIQAISMIGTDPFVEDHGNAWSSNNQNNQNNQNENNNNRNINVDTADTPSHPSEIDPRDGCALNGYYGDGTCDSFCVSPDPDCEQQNRDECLDLGYYNDGECDTFCSNPDPDCEQSESPQIVSNSDFCEVNGYYNDGVCDECDQPDPDCEQSNQETMTEQDDCETYGFYGDGECDTFCLYIDPDCESQP